MLHQALCVLATISLGADWPTHQGDLARTGVSQEAVPPTLHEAWRHESGLPRPAWPEPARQDFWHNKYGLAPSVTFDRVHQLVAAGGRVFFGSTVEDTVTCLDAESGKPVWTVYTEGPVRLAPCVVDDLVYFGSDDGHAYCVSAADGTLVWKRRIADQDRRIGGNGRMISAWPLRCGTLVDNGTVYCTAGIFPAYGVWLAALDAGNGEIRWRRQLNDIAPQGYLLASPTRLYVPTGRTSPAVFDRKDGKPVDLSGIGRRGGTFALIVEEGLVHRGNGEDQIELQTGSGDRMALFAGRQAIVDGETAYLLDDNKLSALNRARYIRLAHERQKLIDAEKADERTAETQQKLDANAKAMETCWQWRKESDQWEAMLLAKDTIIVGGQNEVAIRNTADGSLLATLSVDGAAHGLAIADGRLLVSTDHGMIHCFAEGEEAAEVPTELPPATSHTLSLPARWLLDRAHIRGNTLHASEGGPDGVIRGRLQFESDPECIRLNGTSSVELSDNIATLPFPKRTLSLEAIAAIDKPDEWGAVIGALQDNGGFEKGWLLGNCRDRFAFALAGKDSADADGQLTYLLSETRITPGRWVHLAATYDGNTMRLYVDGRLDATSTEQKGEILYPEQTWLELGAYHDDNENYRLRGRLREVRLLDSVLSESEIAERAKAVAALNTTSAALALSDGPHVRHLAPDQVEISWQSDTPRPMAVQMRTVGGEILKLPAQCEEQNGVTRHRAVAKGLTASSEYSFYITAEDSSGAIAKTSRFVYDAACDVPARSKSTAEPNGASAETAERIIETRGSGPGYALLLDDNGDLAIELARRTAMQVIAVLPNQNDVAKVRAKLTDAGIYGTRAVVHNAPLERLPYASRSMNLVTFDLGRHSDPAPQIEREAKRVLRPGSGSICLQVSPETKFSKATAWVNGDVRAQLRTNQVALWHKPPKQRGQWTHLYSDPSGKAASGETLRAPLQLQWFGRPGPKHMIDRHHRGMSPLVVDGRIFLPGNERLKGVDAFNGSILWDLTLPGFRRVAMMRDSGHLAAQKDEVFAAIRDGCRVIDATTGRWLRTLPLPESDTGAGQYWGYLAVIDDTVLGTAAAAGASYDQHEREIPARVSYWDSVPVVVGKTLFSLDRQSGNPRWIYKNAEGSALLHSTIVAADGRIYFVESRAPKAVATENGRVTLEVACAPGASWLVALDLTTGEKLWQRPLELPPIRNVLHAVCAEDTIILTGSHNEQRHPRYDLLAFNASDGSPRWATHYVRADKPENGDHGEQDQHPVVIGKTVYSRPYAFDVHTGEKLDFQLDRGGHGCGGLSGSACYLFGRGRNPRMYELDPGTQSGTAITQVTRPGCWINMIAADGLLLIPEGSSGCSCAFSIQTSLGLAPIQEQ